MPKCHVIYSVGMNVSFRGNNKVMVRKSFTVKEEKRHLPKRKERKKKKKNRSGNQSLTFLKASLSCHKLQSTHESCHLELLLTSSPSIALTHHQFLNVIYNHSSSPGSRNLCLLLTSILLEPLGSALSVLDMLIKIQLHRLWRNHWTLDVHHF